MLCTRLSKKKLSKTATKEKEVELVQLTKLPFIFVRLHGKIKIFSSFWISWYVVKNNQRLNFFQIRKTLGGCFVDEMMAVLSKVKTFSHRTLLWDTVLRIGAFDEITQNATISCRRRHDSDIGSLRRIIVSRQRQENSRKQNFENIFSEKHLLHKSAHWANLFESNVSQNEPLLGYPNATQLQRHN